ncbi:hypothetical protein [Streptomyces lunaelactis]|uniref:hypothetical protein n=1 Tax=Streptomyces lunaelactis TaxID=1535768 RepID=UPI00131EDCAF|nr:hypothetical protein [Streptomyces lunaelactis]NUK85802.1 hypothetical protein [Streptomyces lunaelactis]NUL06384.1 hypothetical protein [Streptomyces lunaelactis]
MSIILNHRSPRRQVLVSEHPAQQFAIADWQPPQRTYAAGARAAQEGQSAQRQGRPL